MIQKVVKKEKGPAPPPPSLPNAVATPTVSKESTDEKIAPETKAEESDNKPNQKEITNRPTSTTPDDTSSQPEVIKIPEYSTNIVLFENEN